MTLKEQMEDLNVNKESRIAVFGTNEFAELVFLGLREMGIEEIKIFDHNPESSKDMVFLGMPVQEPSNINVFSIVPRLSVHPLGPTFKY